MTLFVAKTWIFFKIFNRDEVIEFHSSPRELFSAVVQYEETARRAMAINSGKKGRKKERDAVDSENEMESTRKKYIFDRDTNEWKMINPAGSTAYNYLTKDEWGWLDMD